MAQSIFTSQTPASGDVSEAGGIALGMTFVPSVDGVVSGIRFFASATVGGTYTGGLFLPTADDDPEGSGAGTLLGSGVLGGAPTPAAWNVIELDPPVAVTAGVAYRAVYHSSAGHYVSTPNFAEFVSGGLVNGDLTAVAAGTNIGIGSVLQGVYRTGGAMAYPSNYFNNSNYFADVVFAPVAAEGAAAFTLELTAAGTGEAPPVAPSEGQAALGLQIAVAVTGETPDTAQGSAAFSLVLAAASSGQGSPPPDVRCGWEGIDPGQLGLCSDWTDRPVSARNAALEIATEFMWAATGRRFGICPVTVRPSQERLQGPFQYQAYPVWPGASENYLSGPFLFGGQWYNRGTSGCWSCCNAGGCAIVLRGPVASLPEVQVDGAPVEPSAYRVDVTNGTYLLVRTDGLCWPSCQNFTADLGAEDTFAVTYGIGRPLTSALVTAVALLACEYVKALTGGTCKLPSKMTRLSRQGIEVEVDAGAPGDGTTGLREVDAVIAALNPSKRQRPPVLLSPDLPENCDRVTLFGGA